MVALFMLLILGFVSAVLAVQIAHDSALVLRVKQFLYLEQPYSRKLFALNKFITWRRIIGTAFYILFPLIFIFILIICIHHFLSELLDCPYCLSFHIMWMLCFFFLGLPIITSLVFGSLGILGVYFIEALRK